MELILKSNNKNKLAQVLALANKLGIHVEQKSDIDQNVIPIPPAGKVVSANELLETFGMNPDFPAVSEIRSKSWPSPW